MHQKQLKLRFLLHSPTYILNFYSRRSQLTTCCTTLVVSCASKRIFWGKKNFLTGSFFKFLSVLGGSRLLSKISLKRKNTVGDNESKYFHITVKIVSRFLFFQDRIWGRKARPKSEISPPPPTLLPPHLPLPSHRALFLAGTQEYFLALQVKKQACPKRRGSTFVR